MSEKDENKSEHPGPQNAKERIYDKIPLSVKQLDVIIVCLVIAFVAFFILGIVK